MVLREVIQVLFVPFLFVALLFYKFSHGDPKESSTGGSNPDFLRFQTLYFAPYFMALFSDWLQGPYVYKLYSYYGFEQAQIAVLFVMGFGSSVTFGTATGPLADKFGRKKLSLSFCVLYTLSCLTKLSPNFYILLLGRLLGGISTSILFSVFESWYLHEHTVVHQFPIEWTSITFSKATFFNGLIAIFAGIVADVFSDRLNFGPVAPFMVAIPVLMFAFWLIYTQWEENHGVQKLNWRGSCFEGLQTILQTPHILSLGLVQSIFESNMYIFVFLWTPTLEPGKPPLGVTFSCFMMAIMIGSSFYSTFLNRFGLKSEDILSLCLGLMAATMFACGLLHPDPEVINGQVTPETSANLLFIFFCFLLLEIAVGCYFPSIGYLRGEVIPDGLRANIMNWFRVPLNIITCSVLLVIHSINSKRNSQYLFLFCGVTSLLGLFISRRFKYYKLYKKSGFQLPDSIGGGLGAMKQIKVEERDLEADLED